MSALKFTALLVYHRELSVKKNSPLTLHQGENFYALYFFAASSSIFMTVSLAFSIT